MRVAASTAKMPGSYVAIRIAKRRSLRGENRKDLPQRSVPTMIIVSQRQMNSLEAKISTYEKALKIVGDWNGLSSEELVNLALSEV